MNAITLTMLAKQAALSKQMVADYPDPNNRKVTFPPSPYYRFLRLLTAHMNASLCVELGVCGGGASLHMAMANTGAVVGVDVSNEYPDNIVWITTHYPNFYFILDNSVKVAPTIRDRFGQIDILFIDTTHTYEQTMLEYNTYLPYLSNDAVVCLDDLFRPGMIDAWNEIPGNKVRFDYLHPSGSPTDGGFGVIWR